MTLLSREVSNNKLLNPFTAFQNHSNYRIRDSILPALRTLDIKQIAIYALGITVPIISTGIQAKGTAAWLSFIRTGTWAPIPFAITQLALVASLLMPTNLLPIRSILTSIAMGTLAGLVMLIKDFNNEAGARVVAGMVTGLAGQFIASAGFLGNAALNPIKTITALGSSILSGALIGRYVETSGIMSVMDIAVLGGIVLSTIGALKRSIQEQVKRKKSSPFFCTLLSNHLKTLSSPKEKLNFLDQLAMVYPLSTWVAFSRSYVEQILEVDQELTPENSPPFFHKERAIRAQTTTLARELNILRNQWKTLSLEEKADVKFSDESHIPKTKKLQEIRVQGWLIAFALQQDYANAMPSPEDIKRVRQTI